jgi:predicted short-subunit dehydrogenase-like oxidoreductase (DUF2520 family)
MKQCILVGAGNVATQMGAALQKKGFVIKQIYSYTLISAETLGNKLHTNYTTKIENIYPDADIYIFTVKDSALPEILQKFPPLPGLLIHTSGSISINLFAENGFKRYGVLYPLQTFVKTREITFENIPLFIEANNPSDERLLYEIAAALSLRVIRLSSEQRQQLHLAAVFACNFTNHMYAVAAQILEEHDLPWNILEPLIQETAAKIKEMHPGKAQTGPAVRCDRNIIDKHLEMLKNHPDLQIIYNLLSENIYRKYK